MPTTTTADGEFEVATKNSKHVAPGPPGISPSVPPPAAGPVPTPFAYSAKSADAKSGTVPGKKFKVKARVLCVDTVMKMLPPVNKPSMPIGLGDIVTKATDLWGVVVDGAEDARAGGKDVAITGSGVRLNAMSENQPIVQVNSKLISGADFDAITTVAGAKAWRGGALKLISDPVSATTGDVVDHAFDVSLPGAIPFVLRRTYTSAFRKEKGAFGRGGWTHDHDRWIEARGAGAVLRMETGHELELPPLALRSTAYVREAKLEITREGQDAYAARDVASDLTYRFAPAGKDGRSYLTEIRDAWGNRIELRYEGGRLTTLVDTAGREVRFSHDRKGRITGVDVARDAAVHFAVRYRYTDAGELGEVELPLGQVTRYEYDGKHRLTTKRMPDAPTFHYAYDDETSLCVKAWSDEGFHGAGLDYEPEKRTVFVHSTPAPRVLTYDGRQRLVREATPDGAFVREVKYDPDGLVLEKKNAAGDVVTFAYDERGHCTERVEGRRAWSWKWEGDRLVAQTDPETGTTTFTYDDRGGLASMTLPAGATLHVTRDGYGHVRAIHGPEGAVAAYEHDASHDLVRETDARGWSRARTYDPLGRLVAYQDSTGAAGRMENDALGRPTTLHFSDGTTERFTWDGRHRVTSFTNERGELFRMVWTGMDALRKVIGPDGAEWTFELDALERPTAVVGPRAERYEIRYDRAGNVREETTFDGSTFRYQHDRAGRLSRADLPGDQWLSFSYDDDGLPIEEDSPHGRRTFAWDERGHLTEAVLEDHDRSIVVRRRYDEIGQPIAEKQGDFLIRYEYDKLGRVALRELPGGLVTRYFHDASGDLVGVDHAGHRTLIQNDRLGREARRHVYTGAIDIVTAIDPHVRWADQRVSSHADATKPPVSLAHRRVTYDASLRPVEIADARWGRTGFVYDAHDRLVGVEGRGGGRYDHDASGAMIGAASHDALAAGPWRVREGNVLLRTTTAEYAYDAANRRRRKTPLGGGKPTEYLWDARSRLREVRLPGGERVLFTYDAFGRRVRKLLVPPPLPPEDLGVRAQPKNRFVEYIWSGAVLAAEIDSERGTRVFVHHPRTMFPLLQIEQGEVFTYVTDAVGTPRELIDERGQIAWAAAISPFGRVVDTYRDPGAKEITTPFRQLGHYADDETGLLYALHRYFDPETARFLSIDPLLVLSGGDLFGLTKSPTFTVDPLGLAPKVGVYGDSMPGVEKHEPLQATWGQNKGLGPRGSWPFQNANPVIGLGEKKHDDVHAHADEIFLKEHGKKPDQIHELPAETVIDVQRRAMEKAKVAQAQVDKVIAASKQHAKKLICVG